MLSFLKKINADVICLQEVLESIHYKILNIKGYFLKTVELKGDNYGIAIYFIKCVKHTDGFYLSIKKEQREFIHTQFFINNKLVNIINTHLGLNEEERKTQIEKICRYVNNLRGKNIICGDFNQTNIKIQDYYDLSILFGCENIETFQPSKSIIDYIFMSQNLRPSRYKAELIDLSDHYPVIGEFII